MVLPAAPGPALVRWALGRCSLPPRGAAYNTDELAGLVRQCPDRDPERGEFLTSGILVILDAVGDVFGHEPLMGLRAQRHAYRFLARGLAVVFDGVFDSILDSHGDILRPPA